MGAKLTQRTEDDGFGSRVRQRQGIYFVLVAVFFAALLVTVNQAWHHRPRVRLRRRRVGGADVLVLPDVAAAIVDEAEAQRTALLGGSPRNAIVRCWLRLEEAVADAGVPPDPAETSAELTERVLTQRTVDPGAIRELAALYREARFSEHPIDETKRAGALRALDRLHAELRTGDHEPAGTTPR